MPNLISELSSLGVLDKDRLEQFYPRVRDREDVAVLRDPVSGVIVLSRSDHVSENYYEASTEKAGYVVHGEEIVTPRLEDNVRRAEDFGGYIRNKRWLDFGCGLGGMLDELGSETLWAAGLEPNRERATVVSSKGHKVIGALGEVEAGFLDVVSMFHVLEHLTEPLETLCELRTRMNSGGLLLVEVPHARDVLFTLYNCEAFKKFTFWSEHLVLHTRHSLKVLLERAGFKNVEVMGHQRYPLANHLYWLTNRRPGGHEVWNFLPRPDLDHEYESTLSRVDRTDTLVAFCRVPGGAG